MNHEKWYLLKTSLLIWAVTAGMIERYLSYIQSSYMIKGRYNMWLIKYTSSVANGELAIEAYIWCSFNLLSKIKWQFLDINYWTSYSLFFRQLHNANFTVVLFFLGKNCSKFL